MNIGKYEWKRDGVGIMALSMGIYYGELNGACVLISTHFILLSGKIESQVYLFPGVT